MFLFWGYVIALITRRIRSDSLKHKQLVKIGDSKTEANIITINYK